MKSNFSRIIAGLLMVCLLAANAMIVHNNTSGTEAHLLMGGTPMSGGDVSSADAVTSTVSTTAPTTTTTTEARQEVVLDLPYFITVDKVGQVVSVYTTNEEGKYEKLVRQMICSTGENIDKLPDGYYPLKDSKKVWNTMLSHNEPMYAQYTTRITGSFLFHSVPYSKWGDKSSLYEWRYKELGTACSGGCIRLTVEGAKWIFDNCPVGTPVYVFKGVYDEALIESLRPADPVGGWDPTDPDPANPNYQPLITTPDPQPDKYAPLYDYNFDWAKEQERIYYTTTTTTTTTTSAATTTTTAAETTTTAAATTTTTAAPTAATTTTTAPPAAG